MSGRAVNWVFENHRTSGSELTVLLAIAKLSRHHSHPFQSFASKASIARLTGLSERYVVTVVRRLIAADKLRITREGKGCRPHLFDPLPLVNYSPRLLGNTSSPPQQGWATETDVSRADPRCEETPSAPAFPNVIPMPTTYPKPKKSKA